MDDLITFLRARLAEDAAVASATLKNEQRVYGTDHWFPTHNDAITSMAPHRAVDEVAAKREIIELAATLAEPYMGQLILEQMALPYAGHSHYQESWKP